MILGVQQIGTVAADVSEALNLFVLFSSSRSDVSVGGQSRCAELGGEFRRQVARQQILPAQGYERRLVGKVRHNTLILQNGFIGFALFAIAFAEAEDGGGGDLPL